MSEDKQPLEQAVPVEKEMTDQKQKNQLVSYVQEMYR